LFDISFTELLLVGVVALVVIGPERLPKVARTVGHLLGRAQRYVSDVKSDIQREVELEDLRKMKEEMESAAQSIHSSFRDTSDSIREQVEEPLNQMRDEIDSAKASLSDLGADKRSNTQRVESGSEGTSADAARLTAQDSSLTASSASRTAEKQPEKPAPKAAPNTAQEGVPVDISRPKESEQKS